MTKNMDVKTILSQRVCWEDSKVQEHADKEGFGSKFTLDELLGADEDPRDLLWIVLHEKVLNREQLYSFAAVVTDRVLHLIPGDTPLRESVEAARSCDQVKIEEMRRLAHRTVRKMAQSKSYTLRQMKAAKAARGCTKAPPHKAAVTACWAAAEASEDQKAEFKWQLEQLKALARTL